MGAKDTNPAFKASYTVLVILTLSLGGSLEAESCPNLPLFCWKYASMEMSSPRELEKWVVPRTDVKDCNCWELGVCRSDVKKGVWFTSGLKY